LAPRHLRVLEKHTTTYSTYEKRIFKNEAQEGTPCLNARRNLDTAPPSEAEQIGLDTVSSSADEISKLLNQQGAKSARRVFKGLLALLAPHHPEPFEKHTTMYST
jgi:hypothetical protein